jgi:hypothetical protein
MQPDYVSLTRVYLAEARPNSASQPISLAQLQSG